MSNVIMKVDNVSKHFKINSKSLFQPPKELIAVNDVSFHVYKGETLGIIGESGSGKSTLGKCMINMTSLTKGNIVYKNAVLNDLPQKAMKAIRKEIQVIFQDPYSSLDPRKTAGYLIEEPMIIHNMHNAKERKERVIELLKLVGLNESHAIRYPHEFSGGQRQRINIARALALDPEIVLADEPVSALDVSVQAQVINLLKDIQKKLGLTYVFISHDLSVVKYISDRIAIMYLGKIVEIGDAKTIYKDPKHPYTKALFSAIPKENPLENKEKIDLNGEIPSPIDLPEGCSFASRCPNATQKCKLVSPVLTDIGENHKVSCIMVEEYLQKIL